MVEREGASNHLVVDYEALETMIGTALQALRNREGLFKDGLISPQDPFIDLAKKCEARGENSFALHAVFQIITVVFQDDSTKQFKRFTDPDSFKKYSWLFRPEEVVSKSDQEVFEAAKDYVKPGTNEIAILEWRHNSQVIVDRYRGDLKNFFEEHGFDALKILDSLTSKESGFKRFGPKFARLFLLWVDHYTLVGRKLDRTNEFGIQIDFQIARLCLQNGVLKLDRPTHTGTVIRVLIEAFTRYCNQYCTPESGLTPQYVSGALWSIGHAGCNKFAHSICPLGSTCKSLVWRIPYDRAGVFDPRDHGRSLTRWQILNNIRGVKNRLRLENSGQASLALDVPESSLERTIRALPHQSTSKRGRLGVRKE